jgi:hypothetical protein
MASCTRLRSNGVIGSVSTFNPRRPGKRTAFLSGLPDPELQTVFDVFLDQYGQELAAGALECSD